MKSILKEYKYDPLLIAADRSGIISIFNCKDISIKLKEHTKKYQKNKINDPNYKYQVLSIDKSYIEINNRSFRSLGILVF